jgi:hypothetical protein
MKKNFFKFSLFFILTLALMSVSTMAQAGGPTSVFEIPYFETVEACNGELVDLEGVLKITSGQTDSRGGIYSGRNTNNIKAEGFGDETGVKYILNAHATDSFHSDFDDFTPENSTQVFRSKLIGKGNVPDTTMKFYLHYTINGNGDFVFFNIDFSEECSP